MSHLTVKSSYKKLVDRINQFPQGAPPSELLNSILKILYTEKEANLVSLVPIKPFTVSDIAKIWKMADLEAHKILDRLCEKGILLDIESENGISYVLPPPMAGFFEFSLMRMRDDIDQKVLSELFHQYLNVEEEFIKDLFAEGETNLGRVFVNEKALSSENLLQVLDYEKTGEIIETATHISVGMCYCRHKMQYLGKNCDAPMDLCLTFNNTARSLIKHGVSREIDVAECKDLIDKAHEYNLVQFGENVQNGVGFICNCCGCCCEALLAAKKFGFLNPVQTTSFLPTVNEDSCNGCGRCAKVCPVNAITITSKKAKINDDLCLGCAVCINNCPQKCMLLKKRKENIITPVDSVERVVLMAVERGKLQNLIFDNHALWNHRAMAAILGVILKLPPVKQMVASKQFKSKYLRYLIDKFGN